MIDDRTREDLIALLESPGWRWFVNYADESWTGAEAYRRRIKASLAVELHRGLSSAVITVPVSTPFVVDETTRAIEILLEAPQQAIGRSKG